MDIPVRLTINGYKKSIWVKYNNYCIKNGEIAFEYNLIKS